MKIALIGYGKMGHMIEQIALERGHSISCAIDRLADRPASPVRLFSPEEGFESEEFRSSDVAIEFSTPGTAKENVLRAWAQGVPVVCGTTGWKPEELRSEGVKELRSEGEKILGFDENGKTMLVWSSNFSVGVNIFFNLNKYLAEEIKNTKMQIKNDAGGYTPTIKEIHHIHKLDKPSGTAVALAEAIQNSKIQGFKDLKIPIESIREGEVPGTHEVRWDSEEDTIVITHIAKGRRGFALGAVLAAEQIKG